MFFEKWRSSDYMCVSSGLWYTHIMSAFSEVLFCQHCFISISLNVVPAETYKSLYS